MRQVRMILSGIVVLAMAVLFFYGTSAFQTSRSSRVKVRGTAGSKASRTHMKTIARSSIGRLPLTMAGPSA